MEPDDRVICINDAKIDKRKLMAVPVKNAVYTIRARDLCDCGFNGVFLCEIVNPAVLLACKCGKIGIGEPSFFPERFRPASKTDISIFTSLLYTAPKKRRAETSADRT